MPSLLLALAEELWVHGYPHESHLAWTRVLVAYAASTPEEGRSRPRRYDRARALYELGDYRSAAAVAEELVGETPSVPSYLGFLAKARLRAELAAIHGRETESLQLLKQATANGYSFRIDWHREPDLMGLHDNPAFREMLEPRG